CAVDRHMRATGIIRNHASQRRTRARGHVRPKTITVRLEKIIELVEDDPGSYTDGPALKVEIGYLPNITRAIDDQAVANGSANQAGAGSTRDDRYARLAGRLYQFARLPGVFWECDCRRLDLVNGGVRCVQLARQVVKSDLASGPAKGCFLLGRDHRARI